jgi:molybdopterin converting factor small subunit
VVAAAAERFGPDLAELLPRCRVWVNGVAVPMDSPVDDHDEVAILPPVSGGS